jgi:hypothetical protein
MTSLKGGDLAGSRSRLGKAGPISLGNNYVTQCKICCLGVFKHQEYRWSANPVGISHSDCLDKENDG